MAKCENSGTLTLCKTLIYCRRKKWSKFGNSLPFGLQCVVNFVDFGANDRSKIFENLLGYMDSRVMAKFSMDCVELEVVIGWSAAMLWQCWSTLLRLDKFTCRWSIHGGKLFNLSNAVCEEFSNVQCNCRRETARYFVSFNISVSHSRSFEMTPISGAYESPC